MSRLSFSEADRQVLHFERFAHPHPRVQQRMEVLWLISQGLVYSEVARLAGVSEATVDRYVACYRQGGLTALREFHWGKSSVSKLVDHRDTLEKSFRDNPPHTVAEACQRIKEETGIERRPTQVRAFLKKCLASNGVVSLPFLCRRKRPSENMPRPKRPS
jgi:transposase